MKYTKKHSPDKTEKPPLTRRAFLKKILLATAGVAATAVPWYAVCVEPQNVRFQYHTLPIPYLPKEWQGKKLVQVSDIHASKVVKLSFLKKTFEGINRENPDIIVLTGDYVTNNASYAEQLAECAAVINRKITKTRIAVTGNHDRWTSFSKIMGELEAAGFNILVNQYVQLGQTAPFHIIGIDDLWTGTINLKTITENINLNNEAALLLSHNPDIFNEAAQQGFTTVLAGHTHGGQIVIPGIGSLITPSKYKYTQGFYHKNNTIMYINRGLGVVSPPVRLCCPPEVTVFTLQNREPKNHAEKSINTQKIKNN